MITCKECKFWHQEKEYDPMNEEFNYLTRGRCKMLRDALIAYDCAFIRFDDIITGQSFGCVCGEEKETGKGNT